MENLKLKLGKGGLAIAALGIMSMILAIFDYNIRLLAWVDLWGEGTGWAIRVLLVVVGGALFFLFGRGDDDEDDEE